MSDCYIAAALFTPAQIAVNNRIAAIVSDVGIDPVLPQQMSAKVWQGRAPKDCTQDERREVVDMNINGMRGAKYMIARVSGDTKEVDTGVAWEMGYFLALAHEEGASNDHITTKQRILIAYIEPSDRAQSLNLMLAETVHAAVYGQAQLHSLLSSLIIGTEPPIEGAIQHILAQYAPSKIVMHEREPIGFAGNEGDI